MTQPENYKGLTPKEITTMAHDLIDTPRGASLIRDALRDAGREIPTGLHWAVIAKPALNAPTFKAVAPGVRDALLAAVGAQLKSGRPSWSEIVDLEIICDGLTIDLDAWE